MSLSERMKNVINFIYGFRKFTIIAALIIVGVVFRIANLITGQEMVDLLRYTTVAFMAGNTVEHVGKAVQKWVEGKVSND